MKKSALFCFLSFSICSILVAKDWALTNPDSGWNTQDLVRRYFHNSELQTQWAQKALSHYHFLGNERILDFGCGDGKLSAMLSNRTPDGKITAVDISKEMIAFASQMFASSSYPNLDFVHSTDVDFSNNTFSEKFDLITSFCVFHLVPNPFIVLGNLKKQLKPNGKLVFTYPIGGNSEFFRAASEEMTIRKWNFPLPTRGTQEMRNPEKARQMLATTGFNVEHFQVVHTTTPFSSIEELVDYFEGTLAANWSIPQEGRRQFFIDLTDRYLTYRPQDRGTNGFVYFSIDRLDIVASYIQSP